MPAVQLLVHRGAAAHHRVKTVGEAAADPDRPRQRPSWGEAYNGGAFIFVFAAVCCTLVSVSVSVSLCCFGIGAELCALLGAFGRARSASVMLSDCIAYVCVCRCLFVGGGDDGDAVRVFSC